MNNFGSQQNPGKSAIGIFSLLLIAGILALFQSCTKEHFNFEKLKDPTWNPTYAVPLVSTTLGVSDILDRTENDSVIVVRNDSLVLVYVSELFSAQANELITIPNLAEGGPVGWTPVDIADYATNGSRTISISVPLDMGTSLPGTGSQFERIDLKGGEVVLFADGNTTAPSDVSVTVGNLTNGGVPFTHSGSFNGPPSFQTIPSSSLNGYSLDMTAANNVIDLDITITFPPGGTPVQGQVNNYEVRFENLEYSLILGDLGQVPFNTGRDSVTLGIFDNTTDGNIFYEDPSFLLTFENSIGAEVRMDMNTIDAVPESGVAIPVTGISQVTILAPNTQGNSEITDVRLTTGNSNIKTVVDASPRYIVYNVSSLTNPAGGTNTNFILDSSRIRLVGEIDLPFWGRAEDFTKATDTIEFDPYDLEYGADEGIIRGEIASLTLQLNFNNGFPAEGRGQVYFMDSNYVLLDSLIEDPAAGLFASGNIDNNGNVTSKRLTTTPITVTSAKLEKLKTNFARYLYAVGTVETTNQGQDLVRIFESYEMDLDLGMKVEFKAIVEADSLRSGN